MLNTDENFYEILQISRNADPETVHRVFKIMARRFHPDNPETGDTELFHQLQRAYQVLSNPQLRAQYDAMCGAGEPKPSPIFDLKDFVIGVEGEKNRRLGVLSLLYHSRRIAPDEPGVSLLELEKRMGFPREYLNFTLWYLRSRGYIGMEQNSDYGLTAEGVDFLEAHASDNHLIRALLAPGPSATAEHTGKEGGRPAEAGTRVC